MIVTHFSFGSTFDFHGWSTSPFFTLLEWKYRDGSPREADPNGVAGLESNGEANGFDRGIRDVSPLFGFTWYLLSGVPGRNDDIADDFDAALNSL